MSGRRLFLILVLARVLAGCGDLERTNPLDPKNPKASAEQPILVEAFVNSGSRFSQFALDALEQLERAYPADDLIIVEYHLPVSGLTDANAQASLQSYYAALAPGKLAIPDVYFNGAARRVQGASSTETAYQRYSAEAQRVSGWRGRFLIEVDHSISGQSLKLSGKVGRLGDEGEQDVELQVVVFRVTSEGRRIALVIAGLERLGGINGGETRAFRVEIDIPASLDPARTGALLYISRPGAEGKNVEQSVEIPSLE